MLDMELWRYHGCLQVQTKLSCLGGGPLDNIPTMVLLLVLGSSICLTCRPECPSNISVVVSLCFTVM